MPLSLAPRAVLNAFRVAVYACFRRRADALFELAEALLTAGPVLCPAHLSLESLHRRGWGSVYGALAHGVIDEEATRDLLAQQGLPDAAPVCAVDTSVWPRCDAETSPGRGFYYHPSRHSAGQPIVAGWAYQWIAQLGVARDSWTAPVDVRRVHPTENANTVAVEQIKTLLQRRPVFGVAPLFVFDAGYDPLQLADELGDAPAAILVRLRRGRCFYTDPPPYTGRGRPRRHGRKFATDAPATWWTPTAEHREVDDQYGVVRVRAWAGMHAIPGQDKTRRLRGPKPVVAGTLILVEVSRLPGRTRTPTVVWLAGAERRGMGQAHPTWRASGGRMCGASIWNTPSASSRRA